MDESVSLPATNSEVGEELPSASQNTKAEDTRADLVSGLTAYLSKHGLGEAQLTKVASLLQTMQGKGTPQPTHPEQQLRDWETTTPKQTIKLYVAEEQQILRDEYQSFFKNQPTIEVLGSWDDISSEPFVEEAIALKPNVMLLGVKTLQVATVEKLQLLREACPEVAIVLLFALYDLHGIKALREFSRNTSVGCAYLLKHTLDTVEQLTQVVHAVAEGRIIVDPVVMEQLISTSDAQSSYLKELSPKALEVLSLVARGYRNDTIANLLSRDVKTIERHINNIYSKLQGTDDDSKHPRVRAALMYLRATGSLSTEQLIEE